MALLDQLNASTKWYQRSNPALVDAVFQQDPFFAYCRLNLKETFSGGTEIREGFNYNGLIGGAFGKGKTFNIAERQVEQSLQLPMRFYEVNVTLSKIDMQVLNRGPQAVYRLLDSRMTSAYMSIGAHIALSLYMNGSRAGFTQMLTGLAESLNDNVTASWDNNTYASYGGITRSATAGTAGGQIRSVPTNVNGTIEYIGTSGLEATYNEAAFGNIEPNLGVTTVIGYSLIKEKFQTQQRFNDTQDPAIGFNGLKFNSATLIKSRYVPGSYLAGSSGAADPVAVTFMTESSNGALTAYPTLAVASSESLFWLNAKAPFMSFYVSDDPEFGFGFSGFKPAQDNAEVAGQVFAACQLVVHPRYHKQIYGITG